VEVDNSESVLSVRELTCSLYQKLIFKNKSSIMHTEKSTIIKETVQ
jgi:hypothetical protein